MKTRVSTSKQGSKVAKKISKLNKVGGAYTHNGVDKLKQFNARSQARRFVGERSPTFQYFIDVAALAFVLTLLVLMLGRVR